MIGTNSAVLAAAGGSGGNGSANEGGSQAAVVAALREGLVGYWPLDETSGNVANDHSGNGNHGTLQGGISLAQNGVIDGENSMQFNGNGRINIPNSNSIRIPDFSASLWISTPNVNQVWGMPFTKSNDSTAGSWEIRLHNNQGRIEFRSKTPDTSTIHTVLLSNNNWHHIAVVKQGTNATIWLDGVEGPTQTNFYSTANPTINYLIGARNPNSPAHFFNGLIDEVALWDRPLTSQEIQSLYNSGQALSLIQ